MSMLFLDGIGEIELVRSSRRSLAAEIRPDGQVLVRAPKRYPEYLILDFLKRRRDWILSHQMKVRQKNSLQKKQGEEKYLELIAESGSGKKAIEKMRQKTRKLLSEKVPVFAAKIGVTYGKITVRAMKSRWGSCSIRGDLSFNLLISELPEEIADYVIVHELCHRREMNHSGRFWQLVQKQDPDCLRHRKYLREQGGQLILLLEKLKGEG